MIGRPAPRPAPRPPTCSVVAAERWDRTLTMELGLAGRRALVTGAGKGGPEGGQRAARVRGWPSGGGVRHTEPRSPQASGAALSRRCTRRVCRWWP